MATPYDLLLKGGTVVDPSQGLHSGADVAIKSGRVAAVAEGIPADQAARTIDVSGKMVTPGIIDLHCHFFWGVGNGVDADKDCLPRGTTTVVDGGSSGANSFQGFRRYVLERIRTRAFALLNLSTTGMVDLRTSEFGCLTHADVGAAVRTIEQHRDLIIGLKTRVSNYVVSNDPIPYMKLAREVADKAGTKIAIHIGDSGIPMSEIVPYLNEGDMVVHCYTGRRHGILDVKERVLDAIVEARKRGVLFDSSSGGNHFSFDVARKAIDQGFLPDIISTDITVGTSKEADFHMPLMMTRHLALGMPLDEVIKASTLIPALAIDRVPKLGTLQEGAPADVTVLDLQKGSFSLKDTVGANMAVTKRFEPVLALRDGVVASEIV